MQDAGSSHEDAGSRDHAGSGAPGRKRQPYVGGTADRKIQKTIRFPKDLFEEIEQRSLAQRKSVQNLVIELLAQRIIEMDPIEAPARPKHGGKPISLIELATMLGVTPRTAQNWSHEESFPAPVGRREKSALFDERRVLDWAERHRGLMPDGAKPNIMTDDLVAKITREVTEKLRAEIGADLAKKSQAS